MVRAADDRRITAYRSTTGGAIPLAADLLQGELAITLPDKALYTKDDNNDVVLLAKGASAASTIRGWDSSQNPVDLTYAALFDLLRPAPYTQATPGLINVTASTYQVANITGPTVMDISTIDANRDKWKNFVIEIVGGSATNTVAIPAAWDVEAEYAQPTASGRYRIEVCIADDGTPFYNGMRRIT